MRIIFSTGPVHQMGGGTKYASVLAERFNARGLQSRTVSYSRLELTLPIGIRHLVYFFRVLIPLMRADAVLAFDTWSVGIPAVCAAKLLGKPFLVRVGGDFLWEQYVERTGDLVKLSEFYDTRKSNLNTKERIIYRGTKFLLTHADVLACNSKWQIDLWRRVYGVPLAQAVVVENVYPPRRQGTSPVQKNFVAAGRDVKLKQETLLKEIFSRIQKHHPDVSLDMRSLPPAEHQKRVAECYAVVLASVSDVAPNVIIDAVLYDKPFVCTADTGITERLGGTGLFVDTQNTQALQDAIMSLLDPGVYQAQKKKIELFSFTRDWDAVADDFLTAIQTCVS
jgi:glycosyltransferase involved in cell wall biosynthesis